MTAVIYHNDHYEIPKGKNVFIFLETLGLMRLLLAAGIIFTLKNCTTGLMMIFGQRKERKNKICLN